MAQDASSLVRHLLIALILRQFAGNTVTDALAGNESVKPAVEAAWDIGSSLLVTVAVSAITFGILVFLALVLWAPVVAFQKPIGMVLLAALLVLGTEALRRQTAAEFPPR